MESYGGFLGIPTSRAEHIDNIQGRIQDMLQKPQSPRRVGNIARLMALKDQLIAKESAKQGAALAAASIPGLAGGLAGSGIRGMDIVEHEFNPEVIRAHNLEGAAQGLRGFSQVPPGSGRLTPISFKDAAGSPIVALVGGAGAIGAVTALQTPQINWAILKLVALTTQAQSSTAGVFGVMDDFKIGGLANLFMAEDFVPMDDFDVDRDTFAGLRAYPNITSPNVAYIEAAAWAPAGQSLYSKLSIVTDVLRDDAFGPGLPGGYAR